MFKIDKSKSTLNLVLALFLSITSTAVFSGDSDDVDGRGVTIESAVETALAIDPWLVSNKHSQNAIEAMSVAAGELPDPKVSLGIANLATDTFNFQQERMTQTKIGISQLFPRGDSRGIRKKQLETIGDQYPLQRQDRKAKVVMTVSQLWLDAYKAQESIVLIENDRALFEQLADVAQASYSSAVARTRQQDIVRADLELTQLDDRLTVLRQQQEMSLERLSEWISSHFTGQYLNEVSARPWQQVSELQLAGSLPNIGLFNASFFESSINVDLEKLGNELSRHPAVKALDERIQAAGLGVNLAKQKYKPEWGVNASYGYRGDDLQGGERADLFSFGVTFDAPIFTAKRQDKEVSAAVSEAESLRTDKWLLLRKMMSSFETAKAQLSRLNDRQLLYQSKLLPQMYMQADASLTAYTNDDGDFAEAFNGVTDDYIDYNVSVSKDGFSFMVSCAESFPYICGGISKSPPMMISPSIRSR